MWISDCQIFETGFGETFRGDSDVPGDKDELMRGAIDADDILIVAVSCKFSDPDRAHTSCSQTRPEVWTFSLNFPGGAVCENANFPHMVCVSRNWHVLRETQTGKLPSEEMVGTSSEEAAERSAPGSPDTSYFWTIS